MKHENHYEEISQEHVCSITPTEFEEFCVSILHAYGERDNLYSFKIEHNQRITAHDGTFQIDIMASFFALGVRMTIICECKQYKRPVERSKIVELQGKIQSIGANKGILLSTSGFQDGAIQYAKAHGISLIRVYDKSVEHFSFGNPDFSDNSDPFVFSYNALPPYFAIDCTEEKNEKRKVYPTRKMNEDILRRQMKMVLGKDFDPNTLAICLKTESNKSDREKGNI